MRAAFEHDIELRRGLPVNFLGFMGSGAAVSATPTLGVVRPGADEKELEGRGAGGNNGSETANGATQPRHPAEFQQCLGDLFVALGKFVKTSTAALPALHSVADDWAQDYMRSRILFLTRVRQRGGAR